MPGAPDSDPNSLTGLMRASDLIIGVGWIAFWVYWLAAASGMKEGRRTRGTGLAGTRVAIILLMVVVLRSNALGVAEPTSSPWLRGAGLAMFSVGLAIAIWARVHLGRNWGMPMTEKVDPDLVTTGPYRRVRHPIYSGILLAMIGSALAISLSLLVAVLLLGGYFVYSAVVEERFMATRFPDAYPQYKQSSKMLVPYIF